MAKNSFLEKCSENSFSRENILDGILWWQLKRVVCKTAIDGKPNWQKKVWRIPIAISYAIKDISCHAKVLMLKILSFLLWRNYFLWRLNICRVYINVAISFQDCPIPVCISFPEYLTTASSMEPWRWFILPCTYFFSNAHLHEYFVGLKTYLVRSRLTFDGVGLVLKAWRKVLGVLFAWSIISFFKVSCFVQACKVSPAPFSEDAANKSSRETRQNCQLNKRPHRPYQPQAFLGCLEMGRLRDSSLGKWVMHSLCKGDIESTEF